MEEAARGPFGRDRYAYFEQKRVSVPSQHDLAFWHRFRHRVLIFVVEARGEGGAGTKPSGSRSPPAASGVSKIEFVRL
jgi:hypothetical protein